MRLYQIYEAPRALEDISQSEISQFIQSMDLLVSAYKSNHTPAANIHHSIRKQGIDKFIDWLQENVVPIWEDLGYPEKGTPGWNLLEQKVKIRFLFDTETANKLSKNTNTT